MNSKQSRRAPAGAIVDESTQALPVRSSLEVSSRARPGTAEGAFADLQTGHSQRDSRWLIVHWLRRGPGLKFPLQQRQLGEGTRRFCRRLLVRYIGQS